MRVLLKRVPKKTDHKLQTRMMEGWYDVIVETYAPRDIAPVDSICKAGAVVERNVKKHSAKAWHKVK